MTHQKVNFQQILIWCDHADTKKKKRMYIKLKNWHRVTILSTGVCFR